MWPRAAPTAWRAERQGRKPHEEELKAGAKIGTGTCAMVHPDRLVQHGGRPQEPLAAVGLGEIVTRRTGDGRQASSSRALWTSGQWAASRGPALPWSCRGCRGAAVGLDAT